MKKIWLKYILAKIKENTNVRKHSVLDDNI